MRLQPVNDPREGQRVQCAKCAKMIDANSALADLDDKASTFYHASCVPAWYWNTSQFLYMHSSKEHRGHNNHYVKVWRIQYNQLHYVGNIYYHAMDDIQAVCEILVAKLPDEFGGQDKMEIAKTLDLIEITAPYHKSEYDVISA